MEVYDINWLLKYQNSKGTDRILKNEEITNFQQLIPSYISMKKNEFVGNKRFLDIGTCTGRYPLWAHQHGFSDVFALEKSDDAYEFSKNTLTDKARMIKGDILEIARGNQEPECFNSFDLITMMFGTANHFEASDLKTIIAYLLKILSDTGCIIISSWKKTDWVFSLYNQEQKNILTSRSLDITGIRNILSGTNGYLSDSVNTNNFFIYKINHNLNYANGTLTSAL